jgi:hypothetical protein
MDALPPKVDSISGEVSQISDALRSYLEHGLAWGRKVQPPKTKAGRDLLQHVLGRLDQVSTGLNEVRRLAAPHISPSSPAAHRPDTPPSSDIPAVSQHITPAATGPAEHEKPLINGTASNDDHHSVAPAPETETDETKLAVSKPIPASPPAATQDHALTHQSYQIRLSDGSVYQQPLPSSHASPLFDCTYQDIHILNEELFELYSSHPTVRDLGYFKIQVRDLPHLDVQKVGRPSRDHATSFSYKSDKLGLVKVDTGKRFKFSSPHLPLPMSAKMDWSLEEQIELWNSSAAEPPKGTRPYIIGNPLFHDVELSPGEKLRSRGRAMLEGINTQYVYFNLTGKTITTMHREDAHVRSENLLRSGQHKFWCFVKPSFARKLEERMAIEYPEMRRCSQAVRHLSRHIPPAKLDEWGVEYTLDYCVPGQAVVTEPGTYHQVLNLGPNYAIAINLEYNSSPDMPPDYRFCDRNCPDKFAMTAEDFKIYDKPREEQLPRTPETTGSQEGRGTVPAIEDISRLQSEPTATQLTQPATPPPEQVAAKSAALLPEQAVPERHQQYPPVNAPSKRIEAPSPPVSEGKITQSQSPEYARPALSVPIPERSMPSSSGSAGKPSLPSPQANSVHTFSLPAPQPAHLTPPTSEILPNHSESAVTPAIQPFNAPIQSQNSAPGPVAYSVQVVSHAPSSFQPHSNHSGSFGPRIGEPAPLRKTARMINPDREHDEPSPRAPKRQRAEPPAPLTIEDVPVRGALEHLSSLLRGRENALAGSLAAEKLSGKPAFERLAHLVREWRRYSKTTPTVLGGFGLVRSVEETLHGYPELHMFLSRFFKMKVATCVENTMARPGQQPPPNFLNGMLQTLGWTEAQRPDLHDYLREGKCWATICGGYDGLLCLIPADSDCLDLALFQDELARFHAELDTDFVRRLCAAGDVLQRSIWQCLELPEFIWESTTTTWLPLDRISPLLAPFRLLRSNHYDPDSGFYWPRPAGWSWAWPSDPSAVRPGDKACSLCPRKSCRCAETKAPQIPRIIDDGSKGRGVRSIGSHRANDILGELVGELVPLGSCAGDWTLTLRRPDLEDEPVADIYPRRLGNWVRKVHHSADPSAVFRVMKISGRWRQMLVAVRDIGDGEEITARYGKGFAGAQPYSLVEGLH